MAITPSKRTTGGHSQIHNVLKAKDVPVDVFVTIIFHEMLHLEIPPVLIRSGKWYAPAGVLEC